MDAEQDQILIHFVKSHMYMNWQSDSSASETNSTNGNDPVSSHYANITGYFSTESDLKFELWIHEGTGELDKHTLSKSEVYSSWAGTEWYYNSDYGKWYVRTFSECPSATDNSKCSQILFEPDERQSINCMVKMLLYGCVVQ